MRFLNYFFCHISWNSNDWIVRNRHVSAKAIGLNFSGNCACAALNWVPRLVAQGFLRFISFKNVSFESKQCVNQLIHIELFVLLFHNTADRAETLFSHLKKAANSGNTNYFDCKFQTSKDESVRLVCYSPKKRESLQQAFASQSLVKIVGTKKTGKKRFNGDTEDHCISKHVRITPADHLSFPFNPSMGNHLHTVKQILEADMYEIVDLKVKILKLLNLRANHL